jgi:hypothetical protein
VQNFIKTIINAIKSWGREQIRQSTADWNQNNSSADSYIKNRPFYEENGVIHKLDLKYLPDNIGGIQPDWNQNDSEAKDYIKNRPFYEEAYIEQMVFDGNITFDENNLYFFDTTIYLKENVTYTIVFDDFVGEFTSYWDDVDGTCVSLELSAGDLLWIYQRYVWINSSRSYEGETHHLKVFKGDIRIAKIEEKFIVKYFKK